MLLLYLIALASSLIIMEAPAENCHAWPAAGEAPAGGGGLGATQREDRAAGPGPPRRHARRPAGRRDRCRVISCVPQPAGRDTAQLLRQEGCW